MMRSSHVLIVVALAVLVSGCTTPGQNTQPSKETVTIAIQPTDPASIRAKADALEAFLEARTDLDIKIYVPTSYAGVVEALKFEHADVAMMSAWPSYLATKIAGAEIVLAEKREVQIGEEDQVQPYYYSYYVVRKDSPYQTLADLRGKRVAFPSETSTSGYVYPLARLVEDQLVTKAAGKAANAADFFGTVTFSGGYPQGWAALQAGQVDATVIAGDVNRRLYFDVLNNTRTVATQGPVPSHAVVFGEHFQGEAREKLKQAFLELRGEHKELMRGLVSAIFVEFTATTTDEHVAALKTALDQVGLSFQERIG